MLLKCVTTMFTLWYGFTPPPPLIQWLSTLESVSPVARIPRKAVGPMYIGRIIPEHV